MLSDIAAKVTQERSISQPIVEKDFWVVTILDWIFNKSKYKDWFVFKGGTNLSKTYKLINRFSEDIDLILNWTKLDLEDKQMTKSFSSSELKNFVKKYSVKQEQLLEKEFVKDLKKYLSKMIGKEANVVGERKRANYVIWFFYPSKNKSTALTDGVMIEISFLASLSLNQSAYISSFIYEQYPTIFSSKKINVVSISWIRTFWEKVCILHAKSFAAMIKDKYSRHYYDVYCIYSSKECKEEIWKHLDVLLKAADFKAKFYYSPQSHYENIKKGMITLIPKSEVIKTLEKDYDKMQEMLFGNIPSFKKILDSLMKLEKEINEKIIKLKQ